MLIWGAVLKNDSKGLPGCLTSTAGSRKERKHFQTITFSLNILIYDSWGGTVSLCTIKKEMVTKGKQSKIKSPVGPYHFHKVTN